jgi:beta-phosphoglucomutase
MIDRMFLSFQPRAVIFDVDGTLVDNMPWHQRAFDAFVEKHGLPPMNAEMRRRTDGKRNREIFPMLFGRALSADEFDQLEEDKEGLYRQLSRGQLSPIDGLLDLLGRLESAGIPAGVATSGPRKNVEFTLNELGLATRFAAIARGDQVNNGKPAPDVFLYAAQLLGVPPAECLAFEDAPLGVTAARRAGMHVVAITSSYTAADLQAAELPPHGIHAHFREFLEKEQPLTVS